MRCEGCGASVFEGDAACSECGRELVARSPEPVRAVAEPEVAAEVVAPVVEDAPLPAEAARCPEHPERIAPATCARCGRYCCVTCLPEPKHEPHCAACRLRVRREDNPRELKRLRLELTVSFFFATAVIGLFGVLFPVMVGGSAASSAWFIGGLVFSFLQFLGAVLFAAVARGWSAWIATMIELSAAALLLAAVGPNCFSLVLLSMPLVTVFRIFKWQSLQAEAATLG